MSLKSRWIGEEGKAALRVSNTLQALGFSMTEADCTNYVMNICSRLQADLTQDECLAVVRFALLRPVRTYRPGDLDLDFIMSIAEAEEQEAVL